MKKVLSIVLSLVMLLSVTAGLGITASAGNEVCIDEVNVYNVTEPVAGESPCYDYQMYDIGEPFFSYMDRFVVDYSPFHNGIAWQHVESGGYLNYDQSPIFTAGQTYRVYIALKCTGYDESAQGDPITSQFDDHEYIKVTVNGVEGKAEAPIFVMKNAQKYSCVVSAEFTVPEEEHVHNYKIKSVDRATLGKAGKKHLACSCGLTKTSRIPAIKSISLSPSSFTYNGRKRTPSLVIKDENGKTVSNANCMIGFDEGRRNVGTYSSEIIFNSELYYGVFARTFKINPEGTTVSKVTSPKKKQLKITLKKQTTQTTGYKIEYSTSSKFTSKTTKTLTVSKGTSTRTVSKLTSGKKYYVRIRTYKTVNGNNYYSGWKKYSKGVKVK